MQARRSYATLESTSKYRDKTDNRAGHQDNKGRGRKAPGQDGARASATTPATSTRPGPRPPAATSRAPGQDQGRQRGRLPPGSPTRLRPRPETDRYQAGNMTGDENEGISKDEMFEGREQGWMRWWRAWHGAAGARPGLRGHRLQERGRGEAETRPKQRGHRLQLQGRGQGAAGRERLPASRSQAGGGPRRQHSRASHRYRAFRTTAPSRS